MMENPAACNTVENCVAQPDAQARTSLVVGIATRGRPTILAETIAFLANQKGSLTRSSWRTQTRRMPAMRRARFPQVTFIQAELGLTRQRNAILNQAS
jgi:hypothetical protein